MYDSPKPLNKTLRNRHRYLCVRGKKTRSILHLPTSVPCGDGGLLIKEAYLRSGGVLENKSHLLGIVPHYVDHKCVSMMDIVQDKRVLLINVLGDVEGTFKQIARCEYILSSSLHGLVAADSLGIPNRRFTTLTSKGIHGKGFKYADYYSVFSDLSRVDPIYLTTSTSAQEAVSTCIPYRRGGMHQLKATLQRTLRVIPSTLPPRKNTALRPKRQVPTTRPKRPKSRPKRPKSRHPTRRNAQTRVRELPSRSTKPKKRSYPQTGIITGFPPPMSAGRKLIPNTHAAQIARSRVRVVSGRPRRN